MSNVINSYTGARATDRGTQIAKPGQDMDKNTFLIILSIELLNTNPTRNNDSTQYVTQMAQFASMKQMINLNTTMSSYAHNSTADRGVTSKSVDSKGKPHTGVVKSVTSTSAKTTISVEVNENGNNIYKDLDITDVPTILDVPDYSLPSTNSINGNMSFLVTFSFIGKHVELGEKASNENNTTGEVLGVLKDQGIVKVRIKLHDPDEIREFTYDKIIKASNSKEEIKLEEDQE